VLYVTLDTEATDRRIGSNSSTVAAGDQ